jgi:hypothetical protein
LDSPLGLVTIADVAYPQSADLEQADNELDEPDELSICVVPESTYRCKSAPPSAHESNPASIAPKADADDPTLIELVKLTTAQGRNQFWHAGLSLLRRSSLRLSS